MTLEPVYIRLFRRYFQATINRLNTTIDEVAATRTDLQHHIAGLNRRLDQLSAQVTELDRHVHTVVTARWDDAAMVRRMAAIEERLERG
jgi:ABC-type transporter Mla subunit MlaD